VARLELYLLFVDAMRNFKVEAADGQVDLVGDLGLVVEPRPCNVKVTRRR